jgi:hypothetical protein
MKTLENQNEILNQATSVKDFVQISKKAKLYQFVNYVYKKPGSLFRKKGERGKKVKPFVPNYLKH